MRFGCRAVARTPSGAASRSCGAGCGAPGAGRRASEGAGCWRPAAASTGWAGPAARPGRRRRRAASKGAVRSKARTSSSAAHPTSAGRKKGPRRCAHRSVSAALPPHPAVKTRTRPRTRRHRPLGQRIWSYLRSYVVYVLCLGCRSHFSLVNV